MCPGSGYESRTLRLGSNLDNFSLDPLLKDTRCHCIWVVDVDGEVRRLYPGCCKVTAQGFGDCSESTPQVGNLAASARFSTWAIPYGTSQLCGLKAVRWFAADFWSLRKLSQIAEVLFRRFSQHFRRFTRFAARLLHTRATIRLNSAIVFCLGPDL